MVSTWAWSKTGVRHVTLKLWFCALSNRITRDGAKELAALLSQNSTIRKLDLSTNRLEDEGTLTLMAPLGTQNKTLQL